MKQYGEIVTMKMENSQLMTDNNLIPIFVNKLTV